MTPAEILRAARVVIEDPAHWCREAEALNEHGDEVSYLSEDACQWCALGATGYIAPRPSDAQRAADDLLNRTAERMGFPSEARAPAAARLNDTTDHETVMALFSRAIELAEEAERRALALAEQEAEPRAGAE